MERFVFAVRALQQLSEVSEAGVGAEWIAGGGKAGSTADQRQLRPVWKVAGMHADKHYGPSESHV